MSNTKNLCTLSDYSYINQALAMYSSVRNDDVFLHYLCLDDKTFQKINSFNFKNIKAYNINDLLEKDDNLVNLKKSNYNYFCYSLAPYFLNYLLFNNKNLQDITYIDSDIYFHKSINFIFDEIKNNEIGIFRHRHLPLNLNNSDGCFNVGVVYFKNTKPARDVLGWWVDAVLHKKYPFLTTCGDQKYLDMFPFLCPQNSLFIDGKIGHGAPWHWQLYDYSKFFEDGSIIWNGGKQKLIFSHFSKFRFDKELKSYTPSIIYYNYTPLEMYSKNKELNFIYSNYFSEIQKISKELDL
jgi:hypothetical protein